jgi:hypothetical protein
MGKILVGMAAAALWFVFSQAADAERICKDVCNNGICVSRCVDNPSGDELTIREHNPGPGGETPAPSVDIDANRR